QLMTSLVLEGFGATILPTTAVAGRTADRFVSIPIVDLPRRQVGLARRRRAMPSASARAVAGVLQAVISAQGPRQRGIRPVVDGEVASGISRVAVGAEAANSDRLVV